MKNRGKMVRGAGLAVLAFLSGTLLFLLGLYLFLHGYALLHPGQVTEVEHNADLSEAVGLFFRVGYPLSLALCAWLAFRMGWQRRKRRDD